MAGKGKCVNNETLNREQFEQALKKIKIPYNLTDTKAVLLFFFFLNLLKK